VWGGIIISMSDDGNQQTENGLTAALLWLLRELSSDDGFTELISCSIIIGAREGVFAEQGPMVATMVAPGEKEGLELLIEGLSQASGQISMMRSEVERRRIEVN
jgi:hypothetical protein